MDALIGVLTLGYKGAVGDHIGYSILMALVGGVALPRLRGRRLPRRRRGRRRPSLLGPRHGARRPPPRRA